MDRFIFLFVQEKPTDKWWVFLLVIPEKEELKETVMISNGKEVKADFIRKIIAEDMRTNKYGGIVHTRFPPEPNGCLHIGNAMALCLNFEVAEELGESLCVRLESGGDKRIPWNTYFTGEKLPL
jgi:uncharacterized glyoxalase superfamily protein PhnB